MRFDFAKSETHVLINPRMPSAEAAEWTAFLKAAGLQDHFWIATSGSSGGAKWAALSREAILGSAEAVNAHLQGRKQDVWINPLPLYHVGGLGIEARAYLSGTPSVPFDGKWDPQRFAAEAHACRATLTSLVPAQLFDLVQQGLKAPLSLRGTIIGGGALSQELYEKGRELGWHPLPSYGMTECSSQIATAEPASPKLRILPHVILSLNGDNRLRIKSNALLTTYAVIENGRMILRDPKEQDWFTTEDRAAIENGSLIVLGRDSHFIKIGGESVNFSRLESIAESLRLELPIQNDFALATLPDERLGHVIVLFATGAMDPLVQAYNERVMPYERIRKVISVNAIPRTSLGKVETIRLHAME